MTCNKIRPPRISCEVYVEQVVEITETGADPLIN